MPVFNFQLPNGEVISIDAPSQEAAQRGLKNVIARKRAAEAEQTQRQQRTQEATERAKTDPEYARRLGLSDEDVSALQGGEGYQPSVLNSAKRGAGLATRAAVQGAADLPLGAVDAVNWGLNKLEELTTSEDDYSRRIAMLQETARVDPSQAQAAQAQIDAINRRREGTTESASQQLASALTAIGLPEPDSEAEKRAGSLIRVLAGTATGIGAGKLLMKSGSAAMQKLGQWLAAGPGTQMAGAATGEVARQEVEAAGGGTGAQLAAALGGNLAAGIVPSVAGNLTRRALRGSITPEVAAQRLRDAQLPGVGSVAAGVNPEIANMLAPFKQPASVAQVSESPLVIRAQHLVSQTWGGNPAFRRVAEATSRAVERGIDDVASPLRALAGHPPGGLDAAAAGRTLEKGLLRSIGNFRATMRQRYNQLDGLIDKAMPVAPSRTRSALTELLGSSDSVTAELASSKLAGVRKILEGQGDALTYEDAGAIRQFVANQMSSPSLLDDAPAGAWKKLYGALAQDVEDAIGQHAGEDVLKQAQALNRSYGEGVAVFDDTLRAFTQKLDRKGVSAEQLFDTFESAARRDTAAIKQLMQDLSKPEQEILRSELMRGLGRARPSAQDAEGAAFSLETFLTNWNKIPEANKVALFGKSSDVVRGALNSLARTAERVRATRSGTAQIAGNLVTAGSVLASIATGNLAPLAVPLGTATGGYLVSKLMTSPGFLQWMVKAAKVPNANMAAHLSLLANVAKEEPDSAEAIKVFVDAATPQ